MSLFTAAAAAVFRFRGAENVGLCAPAGVLLALIAAAQAWLAWRLRPSARLGAGAWLRSTTALRAVFVGAAVCYAMMLFVGPRRGGGLLFIAGAMAWMTLLALPLTASAETIERLRRWLQRPGPRHCSRTAFISCMALLLVEGVLRGGSLVWGPEFFAPSEPVSVTYLRPAIDEFVDCEAVGEWPVDQTAPTTSLVFTQPTRSVGATQPTGPDGSARGSLRVAVVGDHRLTASEAGQPAAASLLESSLAGIEVVNIGAPKTPFCDCAAKALKEACQARPDLMLVFVSVADDIAAESPRADVFDWRGLSLSRAVARWTGWPAGGGRDPLSRAVAVDCQHSGRWEDYVLACAPQLAACRKPADASMQRRWKSTFAYMDDLEAGCRKAKIPLALVVAPSPLQTNRALLDAVCRRQGCSATDVDLELPQRRLAVYAAQRNLPALDLLPAMKHSSGQPFVHQGWQWTEAGRSSVARALDGWLRSTFASVLTPARSPVAAAWNTDARQRLVAQ